jgi:hypothetical protein
MFKNLNAAGFLALAVVGLLAVGALGLGVQAVLSETRGLEGQLEPIEEHTPAPMTPTNTPRPTATATPGPTATPEPPQAGWTTETDFDGSEYLSPPADVEEEIRAAFNTVLRCDLAPDEGDVMAYDRQAVVDRAREVARGSGLKECEELLPNDNEGFPGVFLYEEIGPKNPVRCDDYQTCTLGRAKQGSTGVLVFDITADQCEEAEGVFQEDALGTMCLARGDGYTDNSPDTIYTATIEDKFVTKEEMQWIVTDWDFIN